jgi:hypothetical protein
MRTGKIIGLLLLLILMLFLGALLPTIFGVPDSAAQGATLPVYTDALAAGWEDWSWGSISSNLANTNQVHGGSNSTSVTYDGGWSGLQLGYGGASLDINDYDTLRFWIHGGSTGGQPVEIQVSLNDSGTVIEQAVTPQANTWTQIDVSLVDYTPRAIYSISWFNNSASNQPTFYVDDIAFINTGLPTPTPPSPTSGPALSVDAAADRHAISPYIYGINHASEELAIAVRLPVRRWGGNSTSRFNWEIDVHNTGSDWYFENIPDTPDTVDSIVEQDRRTGTESLLTMPLIGWTPKRRLNSHPYDCGFKISEYGDQDDNDGEWDPDCGNGMQGGVPITGNDPTDTSKVITESFVTSWINHLTTEFGTTAEGGVMFYNLDNEPMLWNSTHRDVHPEPVDYEEIRDRTYQYGAAIKSADPTAQTLGPVVWGWCAYFYSAADGCGPGADHAAYGDFVPWYLQQMAAYESTHSERILDYLDLHYYPQANGIALSAAGNAQTQALRLRSTRSLWDPTYIDESWISDTTDKPVQLIPRMQQWVNANYPGTRLAITEYNWGALDHINGALAQADVLGIFGREGLDLATLWAPPDINDPGVFAFRMYRNYDGAGSGFGETSIHAASTDQGQLSIYAAQRDSDNALTLLIINKTGQPLTSTIALANFQPDTGAQVFRYSFANLAAIVQEANQPVASNGFTAVFPANSITLAIIPPGGGPNDSWPKVYLPLILK